MAWCFERIFVAEPIIPCLRRLFRRSPLGQAAVREGLASDESLTEDRTSQIAEPPVDEDFEPRPTDAVQHGQPPLPPNCNRLCPGDIEISGILPARAGPFTDVWDGSLAGERVVIKSYRLHSTTDSTHARMVRFC